MAVILIFDYQHRYEGAIGRLAEWIREGRLRYREGIVDGIENRLGQLPNFMRRKPWQAPSSSSQGAVATT
jgi:NADPH-dependent curcumin reductase CurA